MQYHPAKKACPKYGATMSALEYTVKPDSCVRKLCGPGDERPREDAVCGPGCGISHGGGCRKRRGLLYALSHWQDLPAPMHMACEGSRSENVVAGLPTIQHNE